jgi:hypothetical protein
MKLYNNSAKIFEDTQSTKSHHVQLTRSPPILSIWASTNVYHVQHEVQFFPNLIIMKNEVIEDERLLKSNHIRPIIITTGPLTSIGFCVNLLA